MVGTHMYVQEAGRRIFLPWVLMPEYPYTTTGGQGFAAGVAHGTLVTFSLPLSMTTCFSLVANENPLGGEGSRCCGTRYVWLRMGTRCGP